MYVARGCVARAPVYDARRDLAYAREHVSERGELHGRLQTRRLTPPAPMTDTRKIGTLTWPPFSRLLGVHCCGQTARVARPTKGETRTWLLRKWLCSAVIPDLSLRVRRGRAWRKGLAASNVRA